MTNWPYAEPSPVMSSKAINTSGLCDVSAICADAYNDRPEYVIKRLIKNTSYKSLRGRGLLFII